MSLLSCDDGTLTYGAASIAAIRWRGSKRALEVCAFRLISRARPVRHNTSGQGDTQSAQKSADQASGRRVRVLKFGRAG